MDEICSFLMELPPYFQMGIFTAFLIISSCILSFATDEYSWVDRLWSLAPIFHVFLPCHSANFSNIRLNIMFFLIILWGIRLTYNFWVKGGYSVGGEDYRWMYVRKRMNSWQWILFNIFFIHVYQLTLIWGFTAPVHYAWIHQENEMNLGDFVCIAFFLVFLVGETIADKQMWRFQEDKRNKKTSELFYRYGLYKYSRHPNYFCELGMWWCFYGIGVSASGTFFPNWSILGVFLLTLLFQGSIYLCEAISSSKYEEYKNYQKTTSRLIPWFN